MARVRPTGGGRRGRNKPEAYMADSRDKIPSEETSPDEVVAASAENRMSRRRLFGTLVGTAAALGAGLALVSSDPADAQGTTPKKVAKYQDHPKGSQQCSTCNFFKPPHSCQIVAGNISPKGWCSFYAKKA